jgi:UDP-N-acetylmuramoyl-tripeptide--D-alanyl-D-alanine ligase
MMTLNELSIAVSGQLVGATGVEYFEEISTDTRALRPGCVFFALRGEKFDAHDFVGEAVRAGATCVVVERLLPIEISQIQVRNSREALGLAAAHWRAKFQIPVIAVTGSNGKTTVTQMIAKILEEAVGGNRRLATQGNFNNDIGVPLTLFRLRQDHEFAVLELGMNHPGEIAYLSQIVKPTIAVVNNAQREHQEFMGSVEATAQENGQTLLTLSRSGVAIYPSTDECASIWREMAAKHARIEFDLENTGDITGEYSATPSGLTLDVSIPGDQRFTAHLQVFGLHNAHNAMAAIAASHAAGIDILHIQNGLASFRPVKGRCVPSHSPGGATIFDDTYNANPDSVLAAIDLLANMDGTRILVLGDMGEVGDQAVEFHLEVGEYAAQQGLSHVLSYGDLSQHTSAAFNQQGKTANGIHFSSVDDLIETLKTLSKPNVQILVKGSRFMKMEKIVEAIC